MDVLDRVEEDLDLIDKLRRMDQKHAGQVIRILSNLSSIVIKRDPDLIKRALSRLRREGEGRISREVEILFLEYLHAGASEKRELEKERDEVELAKSIAEFEDDIRKAPDDVKEMVREMASKRLFPQIEKKGGLYRVRIIPSPIYKGRLVKWRRNPLMALDSFLLDTVGKKLEPGMFLVPAYGLEEEFANHGHLVAITPDKFYAPREGKNVSVLLKKIQDLKRGEIEDLKRKTGLNRVILVLKGINTILNTNEIEELLNKTNPDYIAIFGTYHKPEEGQVGVPRIDKETVELIKRRGFEDMTEDIFPKDVLKRLERIEKRARESISPWVYFPATRVKVFKRRIK